MQKRFLNAVNIAIFYKSSFLGENDLRHPYPYLRRPTHDCGKIFLMTLKGHGK